MFLMRCLDFQRIKTFLSNADRDSENLNYSWEKSKIKNNFMFSANTPVAAIFGYLEFSIFFLVGIFYA